MDIWIPYFSKRLANIEFCSWYIYRAVYIHLSLHLCEFLIYIYNAAGYVCYNWFYPNGWNFVSINRKHNFKNERSYMYVRGIDFDPVCDFVIGFWTYWVNALRLLIQIRNKTKLHWSMSARATSIYKDPNVSKSMCYLLEKCAIIHADYAPSRLLIAIH